MNEEMRDPALDWVRASWQPPRPSGSFDESVLERYRAETASRRNRFRSLVLIPIAAMVLMTALLLWRRPVHNFHMQTSSDGPIPRIALAFASLHVNPAICHCPPLHLSASLSNAVHRPSEAATIPALEPPPATEEFQSQTSLPPASTELY